MKEPSEAEKIRFWDVDDDYTARILERDREIREILPATAPAGNGSK